jgi:diadenosine tetraphosphate (Ap4A) HIT family hydrolase
MKIFMISIQLMLSFSTSGFANSCPFCNNKIIEEQSAFESEYFHVLVDYMPRVQGHLLVIPKRHVMKAHELTLNEWQELSTLIPKVVKVFTDFLETDQYIILEKNGPKAYQAVPHVHFHLMPIQSQKWVDVFNYAKPRKLSPEELQEEVATFRNYFQIETQPAR